MYTHNLSKLIFRSLNILFAVILLAMSMSVDNAFGQSSNQAPVYQNYLPIVYRTNIIYVDADATGNNDGSSWADAYTSLQAAVDSAAASSQIWVAAGTYYPSVEACGTGSDRYKTFQLKNGVAVYGGFDPSTGDVNWGDRDWELNLTILSGDIGILGNNSDNSYHVVCHPEGLNLDSSAILDGFVIQDGNANATDAPFNDFGGGMFNYATSSPTLKNIILRNNSGFSGGGMYNIGSPTMTNVTFSDNTAISTGGNGGGMFNNGSPTLTYVNFGDNSAGGFGGGMFNGGSPTLTNVYFSDNNSAFGAGGGMYNAYASYTMINAMFSNNSSNWDGGGIYNNNSIPTLVNVTFSGNTAVHGGGGIYNFASAPSLVNVTFYGNTAVAGGGIYNDDSLLTLTNCIMWGNTADEIFNNYSSPVVTYSDIQGGYSGVGNIDIVPQFVDAPNGSLRLLSTSPAIDAGDNAAPGLVGINTDLDGNPRFVDIASIPDSGNGTPPIVDMGAYEVQGE